MIFGLFDPFLVGVDFFLQLLFLFIAISLPFFLSEIFYMSSGVLFYLSEDVLFLSITDVISELDFSAALASHIVNIEWIGVFNLSVRPFLKV